ncbi:hypothetical protein HC174_09655 [Salinimicrobium sp. CDJ15-81-2]|nr:hypothetical protein [Salinimicrobium nanhaiense]
MKISQILEGREKRFFAYLSLFLAISFFFAAIFFGLDFTDSFYHLNQALHPAGDKHLYPFMGSSLMIKGLIELLGPEIIVLRFTNSLLLLISFLFPFLIFKPQLSRNKILIYLACGLILFLPFNVNILGYDTLSILFLSIIFTMAIDHIKNPKFFKLLFLSVLCSAAVLIRLPNVLVLPIIFFWFLIFRKTFPKTFLYRWQAVIFLLLSLLGVAVGYASYYRSWNSLVSASANADSHFIVELLKNYFRDGIQLFFFLSFIFIIYYLFLRVRERISKVLTYSFFTVILLIFMRYYVLPTKYLFNYSLFIFAIVLAFIGIQLFYRKKQSALQLQIYVLYFLFLFINLFGSNTGLLKGYSLFVLFPFVFSIGNPAGKNYWAILLLVLIPFAFVNKFYGIYEDKNLLLLNEKPRHELLFPIRTHQLRSQYLNEIDAEVTELRKKNIKVYFYGDKSHIFHYLYPEKSLGIASFFQPVDNLKFTSHVQEALSLYEGEDIAIFVVDSYPNPDTEVSSKFEKMLLKLNFKKIESLPGKLYVSKP